MNTITLSVITFVSVFLTPYKLMSDSTHPCIIAHRGASYYLPENTLEAFEEAYQMGAKHIEFDCWLTQDQEIVICHDKTLDRTTNLSGPINSYTLTEIKCADAGYHFSSQKVEAKVPTFREVLQWAKDKEVRLYVELKDPNIEISKRAIELIREYGAVEKSVVISFQHYLIEWIALNHPDISIGFSEKNNLEGLLDKANKHSAEAVVVLHELLTDEFMRHANKLSLKVWAFTVRTKRELTTCLDYAVHAYFADQPDLQSLIQEDITK